MQHNRKRNEYRIACMYVRQTHLGYTCSTQTAGSSNAAHLSKGETKNINRNVNALVIDKQYNMYYANLLNCYKFYAI